MVLQTSGVITLQDIENEFGGTGSISLSEYYRGGGRVPSNNTGVPTSGFPISLSNFYGARNSFSFTISANTVNANLEDLADAAGWDGSAPLIVSVNSGIYLWANSTANSGLLIPNTITTNVLLINNGFIIGRGGNGGNGGNGAGGAGGPALVNQIESLTLINNSFIAGGGGGGSGGAYSGGGGGAGGGNGGGGAGINTTPGTGGAGGAIGQAGGNGGGGSPPGADGGSGPIFGSGGQAGGGGAAAADNGSSSIQGGGGGGGGRILFTTIGVTEIPPTGGPGASRSGGAFRNGNEGGDGGGANNVGDNGLGSYGGEDGGGGGGGWGARGGGRGGGTTGAGAGGAAISGTAPLSTTNNGTIYGSVPSVP